MWPSGAESAKVQVVFDYPFFSLSTCTLHFSDRSRYCVLRELNKLFLLHNTIINSSGFIYRLRAKTTQVLSSAHCVRFFCSLDPVRLPNEQAEAEPSLTRRYWIICIRTADPHSQIWPKRHQRRRLSRDGPQKHRSFSTILRLAEGMILSIAHLDRHFHPV